MPPCNSLSPNSHSPQDITEHNGYRQCSFTVIRTLEDICGRIENPKRLQEMLAWLLELFVQRSVEVQKICERENTPLKDKAANIGMYIIVIVAGSTNSPRKVVLESG